MIIWERDTRKYANGFIGYRIRVPFKIFYIGWNGDGGEKPWELKCYLPGFKSSLGRFKTEGAAKEIAQIHFLSWMNALGFTLKRVKPIKQ